MSERSQIIVVWWAILFTAIMLVAWVFLLEMVPPPSPTLSIQETAQWYADRSFGIRFGAMLAAWTSAFMVPITAVLAAQVYRLEVQYGPPIWTIMVAVGGGLMSMFLVFPPLIWGVIAFTADRSPEVTAGLNELANLTLVTTDQFYIFFQLGLSIFAFKYAQDELSPFPRWYAYYNLWCAIAFEVGAVSYMFKTGPFAWDGILVFWMPFVVFFSWIAVTCYMLLKALYRQAAVKEAQAAA